MKLSRLLFLILMLSISSKILSDEGSLVFTNPPYECYICYAWEGVNCKKEPLFPGSNIMKEICEKYKCVEKGGMSRDECHKRYWGPG